MVAPYRTGLRQYRTSHGTAASPLATCSHYRHTHPHITTSVPSASLPFVFRLLCSPTLSQSFCFHPRVSRKRQTPHVGTQTSAAPLQTPNSTHNPHEREHAFVSPLPVLPSVRPTQRIIILVRTSGIVSCSHHRVLPLALMCCCLSSPFFPSSVLRCRWLCIHTTRFPLSASIPHARALADLRG